MPRLCVYRCRSNRFASAESGRVRSDHSEAIVVALGITQSCVTMLIYRLETAGLLRRLPPTPGDRRATLVELRGGLSLGCIS